MDTERDAAVGRSRIVTWEDPEALAAAGRAMTGLEFLSAVAEGRLAAPPIMQTLRIRALEVELGRVAFECDPDESLFNPLGTVHGGVACALLDSAAACAGHSTLPAGVGYTSIDLHVQYLRPVLPENGPFRGSGTVVRGGRRVISASAEMTDRTGALVATATSSLLVIDRR